MKTLHELRKKDPNAPVFKFSEFFSLRSSKKLLEYASERLDKLGCGSSRCAFVLNSRRVLKISTNVKGRSQNRTEVEVSEHALHGRLVARVLNYESETYAWLISELVRPLNSLEEFNRSTGTPFYALIDALEDLQYGDDHIDDVLKRYALHDKVQIKFVRDMVALINETDLDPSEFTDLGHWGKTPDGRIVILDYGLDDWTREKYY